MNILTHYTLRCLKKNKVRTLVTIIGIVLSVALFTAVSEGAYSGQQYLINVTIAEKGPYHGWFEEMEDGKAEELAAAEGVKQVETLIDVGWALVGETTRSYPFLRIASMSEGFPELVTVRIKEGRMPENEHELIISDKTADSTGMEFHVGQVLNLEVGSRVNADGEPLKEYNPYMGTDEHLTDVRTQVYTVVGIYDRFSYDVESYNLPGSLALTAGAAGPNYKAFFTMEDIGDTLEFLQREESLGYGANGGYNRDLLMYAGVSENENLVSVLRGLVAILFGLIFLGSVALIYNSFSISVSERTRQFGLLKSIGATSRQMRKTVLTEAVLLCLIGIPLGLLVGCGGIGLTLRLLQPAFEKFVNVDGADKIAIKLVLNLPALALAAGVGLLTALVSAWIPARRATRLSPMAAIRQSTDVKVRKKEVRVSKLTGKLFGLPGTLAAKNFKRSRKQYRSTVISLFMSIVLFVSAFSFSHYLRNNVAENIEENPADVVVSLNKSSAFPTVAGREAMLQELLTAQHITEGTYAVYFGFEADVPLEAVNQDILTDSDPQLQPQFSFITYYLQDEAYAALCKEAGVDPASGQAVGYVNGTAILNNSNGSYRVRYSMLKLEAIPVTVTLLQEKGMEGYIMIEESVDQNGKRLCGYMKESDFSYIDGNVAYDPDKVVWFTEDEIYIKTQVVIGGLLKELPLAAQSSNATLYLPLSQMPEDLENAVEFFGGSHMRYFFMATDHAKACEELDGILKNLQQEGSGMDAYYIRDNRSYNEALHAVLLILDVFTYGFIILISLIAAANVFNTISTNVALRRREFATLKSVGMDKHGLGRMMRYECLLYGSKALLWGLPVAVGISYLIFRVVEHSFRNGGFRPPWAAMGIAAGTVFLVVGATMLYAMGKIRKENIVETLRNENI